MEISLTDIARGSLQVRVQIALHHGERVYVTRNGKRVAALVSTEDLRRIEAAEATPALILTLEEAERRYERAWEEYSAACQEARVPMLHETDPLAVALRDARTARRLARERAEGGGDGEH